MPRKFTSRRFYTDAKGRVRPVAGGGGKTGSVLLAGLVVFGAVGYGGAVGLTGGSGGGGPGLTVEERTAEGVDQARQGDAEAAWQEMGLHGLNQTGKHRAECVDASFGWVQYFLRTTPCTSMDRALFTVGDDWGNSAVITVAWVEFPSRGDAEDFHHVVDKPGSGDLEPLGCALVGVADIPFSGQNYGSERDRTTVAVAEAEVATGYLTPEVLDGLAEVAARLPR
ncbi:hypothetical protein F4560_002134 [Saccharothrix ecbatanensis]|uniref:Uncharacterized protein n=1 Tax=Saccharothrix ecbatanensis TaxID=1105145 RepID=A0A7W9HHY1_9PSEU|nr:hypothetical protein [Saccharothrix ecbatanensis]MBB5802366.1 hypothetical protein [Saccharothrix ecbatanensis]